MKEELETTRQKEERKNKRRVARLLDFSTCLFDVGWLSADDEDGKKILPFFSDIVFVGAARTMEKKQVK